MLRRGAALPVALGALLMSGCSRITTYSATTDTAAQAREQAKQQAVEQSQKQAHLRDVSRQELEQIPPPSKSLYLAVHTKEAWANPFIVVGRDKLNLRVVYADSNPSTFNPGGLLRPVSAREQDLDVRLADLPSALGAVPENAWPYGRVIAIEEGGTAIKADRAQIRRNVEATIQTLNDLGIVVDEWTGPNGSLLR